MLNTLSLDNSVVEVTDGIHALQDSKSDIALCDPFKGLTV